MDYFEDLETSSSSVNCSSRGDRRVSARAPSESSDTENGRQRDDNPIKRIEMNADDESDVNINRDNHNNRGKLPFKLPFSGWGGPLQVPGKLIFTVGDFFGSLVILAFIFHILILLGTHSANDPNSTVEIKTGLAIMWFFGLNFANLAIIPVYVFTKFSYFKEGVLFPMTNAIYSPLNKFNRNPYVKNIFGAFFLVYLLVFLIHLIAAFGGSKKWGFDGMDRMLFGVVVIVPMIRYIIIIGAYTIHSWISFFLGGIYHNVPEFAKSDPFLYSIYAQSTFCKIPFSMSCGKSGLKNRNYYSYWSLAWEVYHIAVMIATNIFVIIVLSRTENFNGNCIGFILLMILVITPLSIRIRFPFYVFYSIFRCIPGINIIFNNCDKNYKQNNRKMIKQINEQRFNNDHSDDSSESGFENNYDNENEDTNNSNHDENNENNNKNNNNNNNKNSLENQNNNDNDNNKVDIDGNDANNNNKVNGNHSKNNRVKYNSFEEMALKHKGLGVSSACMYFLIIMIMLIISVFIMSNMKFNTRTYDPFDLDLNRYVYESPPDEPNYDTPDKDPTSQMCSVRPYGLRMIQYFVLCDLSYSDLHSASSVAVMNEFFMGKPYNITISKIGQMDLKEYKFGSMSYFNFDEFNLTVVAIRGSLEGIDWALDIQFFLSSALLTLAVPLKIVNKDETPRTAKAIRSILAAPLRMMQGINLFSEFFNCLDRYYEKEKENFNNNIVFVGHSLGGGLSKLFGHVKGKSAISVSGPGITLFQTIMKGKKKDLNSLITETDVVPDLDLVPRVEQSAATRYRILCNQSFGVCHKIGHTVCMAGIMCKMPHDNFCTNYSGGSVIPSIYSKMKQYAAEN